MHSFKPVQHRKVYVEIAEQIFDAIISRKFLPEMRLPSERDLAQSFGASRSTVREALAVLESIGLIRVDVGLGTFVSGRLEFQHFDKQHLSPIDIMKARRLHETSLVELILERASNRHLFRLEETIEAMERLLEDEECLTEFYEWGVQFHRVFVTLAGNEVIKRVGESLLLEHPMLRLLNRASISTLEVRKRQIYEHRKILTALYNKDEQAAKKAVSSHLVGLQSSMLYGND